MSKASKRISNRIIALAIAAILTGTGIGAAAVTASTAAPTHHGYSADVTPNDAPWP